MKNQQNQGQQQSFGCQQKRMQTQQVINNIQFQSYNNQQQDFQVSKTQSQFSNNQFQPKLANQQITQQKMFNSPQNNMQQPNFKPFTNQPFEKKNQISSPQPQIISNSINQIQNSQFQQQNQQNFSQFKNISQFNQQQQGQYNGVVQQNQFNNFNQGNMNLNKNQQSLSLHEQSKLNQNKIITDFKQPNQQYSQQNEQKKKDIVIENQNNSDYQKLIDLQYGKNIINQKNIQETSKAKQQNSGDIDILTQQQYSKREQKQTQEDFDDPFKTMISQCYRCKNIIKGTIISLSCYHTYDKECLGEHLKAILSSDFKSLYCLCNVRISYKNAQQIFGADSDEMKIFDHKIFSILTKKISNNMHQQFLNFDQFNV